MTTRTKSVVVVVVFLLMWTTWSMSTAAQMDGRGGGGGSGGGGGGGGGGRGRQRPKIFIAGFFPMNTNHSRGELGRGVMPAVRLALDHINADPKILSDYTLDIITQDTECSASVGMKAFFDTMFRAPLKLMLFGAACTQVTDPVAKTSKFWHLTQLSYADTHPMFSRHNYPNLFRVVPSENEFNAPRVELLRRFNWTIVGTLFQNEPRYALAHNRLLTDIDKADITIKTTQSFTDDLGYCLHRLKEQDVRIILGNFEERWARRIFCEAYKLDMYGRKYQWLIVSMYAERWWEKPDTDVTCNSEQLVQAMEGYIATDLLPLRSGHIVTYSGRTAEQYQRQYDTVRRHSYSRFHGYAYDGIWTVALAIHAVDRKLRKQRQLRSMALRDFRYRDRFWGEIFVEALNETSFEGVTGPVRFINNDRQGYIMLKQFQGGEENKIGEYDGLKDHLDLSVGTRISWRGGSTPPRDRTLSIIEHYRINITVYAVLATMAAIGIVVASVFLAINIRFRHHRYIKMSSPYLNNLIIIGCILTYTSIILLGLDSELVSVQSLPFICTVRAWVLMAGFTLAFGSMFSKTWRVHAIFTNIKLNKKVIKDYQLFIVVGILLSIDLAIMTTWQVVDPFYRYTMQLKPYVHPSNEDMLVTPELEFCRSDKMTAFMVTVYAYKGLLMIIGCFLAWETRHVSIPALNDSKYVGMSVYNVVIMCVMGAAISFMLTEQQNAYFILISAFIIFCSTTTLCLVFVPKLVELRRNPNGSDKRSRTTFKPSTRRRYDTDNDDDATASTADITERMKHLQEQNQKCRKTLREKDLQLQALLKQLGESAQEIFGCDIGDRSRQIGIVRRSDYTVKTRNGEFLTVEDDMNSVISISSSLDGETTLTTMDTYIERTRPSFSSNLATIMASTETIGASAARLLEAITFEPLPPIFDARTRMETTMVAADAVACEEPEDEKNRGDDHVLLRTDYREENRTSSERLRMDMDLIQEDSRSGSESDEDMDPSCASATSCSVFTVATASPSLQLRRAFSWGKYGGYLPMSNRNHRHPIEDSCASLPKVGEAGGGKKDDRIGEGSNSAGSWPNVSSRKSTSKTTSRFSPKTFKRSLPRQISEKKRRVDTVKSYSSMKCDVVEYL